jgi:uncharacterized membrane protein HdeD (DUF308 family)
MIAFTARFFKGLFATLLIFSPLIASLYMTNRPDVGRDTLATILCIYSIIIGIAEAVRFVDGVQEKLK